MRGDGREITEVPEFHVSRNSSYLWYERAQKTWYWAETPRADILTSFKRTIHNSQRNHDLIRPHPYRPRPSYRAGRLRIVAAGRSFRTQLPSQEK